MAAIVWGSVFSHDLSLFSAHPVSYPSQPIPKTKQAKLTNAQLLNSAAALFLTQGILVLQPTHTAKQKKQGTYTHAALNDVALATAIAGLVIIEYNKISHKGTHFVSVHAILGLITYILLAIQSIVGLTQYFTPALYGGEANAKKLYKYHRVSGYVILVLMLATICAATQTGFNKNVLEIQLWAVIVASVITLAGVLPRIKKNKFGWMAGQ